MMPFGANGGVSPEPGRRICVIGTSGSGKTFVATALAKVLGLTYVCNDAIILRPGWQPTPDEERFAELEAATRGRRWSFDGNLNLNRPEDRLALERCDTLIWLDLPRWQTHWQVVHRTLARVLSREELWHGNRESLRMMLSRESIIWWSIKTFSRRRRDYAALFADEDIADKRRIRLTSRADVNAWLKSLAHA